jgi:hypothetical protein
MQKPAMAVELLVRGEDANPFCFMVNLNVGQDIWLAL